MKASHTGGGRCTAQQRPSWSVTRQSLSTARLLPIRLTAFSILQRRHKSAARSFSCSISAENGFQFFSACLRVLRSSALIRSEMIWLQ